MASQMKRIVGIGTALIALQALVLYLFGQPPICTCSTVKLWVSNVWSSDMSQHLFDWYTFSHIIHGFIFYWLLKVSFPRMSVWTRLLLAMGAEIAWEIAENTPYVINAYREQALAQGYVGDSIINSVMDTVSMMLGFFLALRLPAWITVSLAIAFEVFTGYIIRDNLTLNVLGFVYQFDFIHDWQAALPRGGP
jgi:hypothetical protein